MSYRTGTRGFRGSKDGGMALLVVLWVTVAMMAMGLSFSWLVRADVNSSRVFREAAQKKFISQAGMERGIMELLYRQAALRKPALERQDICRIDGTPFYGRFGIGFYALRISDESGKIPLNGMTDRSSAVLKNLLLNHGMDEARADTIVDSILDWMDDDELHRVSGAESDHYLSLPSPYRAGNSEFEALEQLLMVNGVTKEILFGDGERQGIIRYLTIYPGTEKINVNAAPPAVLESVPGIGRAKAALIIGKRNESAVTLGDLQELLADDYRRASPYLTDKESSVFEVVSTGCLRDEADGVVTRSVIRMTGPDFIYLYYKCPGEK